MVRSFWPCPSTYCSPGISHSWPQRLKSPHARGCVVQKMRRRPTCSWMQGSTRLGTATAVAPGGLFDLSLLVAFELGRVFLAADHRRRLDLLVDDQLAVDDQLLDAEVGFLALDLELALLADAKFIFGEVRNLVGEIEREVRIGRMLHAAVAFHPAPLLVLGDGEHRHLERGVA